IVFKFGGASVQDASAIRNVGNIIEAQKKQRLMIVVSAMGKTTNALEVVVRQALNDKVQALQGIENLRMETLSVLGELELKRDRYHERMEDVFNATEEYIRQLDPTTSTYDFVYDQIIVTGELISSLALASY